MDPQTQDYYAANAQPFSDARNTIDMSREYATFLARLPAGGHILDAGCGSGRDAKAFLQSGFRVTAMDGSSEIVAVASAYTGLPVQHRTFDQVDECGVYDGIWANASLLHLSKADLTGLLAKFALALKLDGVLWVTVKEGKMERRAEDGRLFSDHQPLELRQTIENVLGLQVLDVHREPDRRGKPGFWVEVLAQRIAVRG